MGRLAKEVYDDEHPLHTYIRRVQCGYTAVDSFEQPLRFRSLLKSSRVYFDTSLPGNLRAESPVAEKLAACEARLHRFRNVPLALYTDGVVELDEQYGAAAMLYRNEQLVSTVTDFCCKYACSYRTECIAMGVGLKRLLQHVTQHRVYRTTCVIVTDSYSFPMALKTGPTTVDEGVLRRIWNTILKLVHHKARLSFHFVFRHCELWMNEAVDKMAKAAMKPNPTDRAWITDLVTTIRRLHNIPQNRIRNPSTLRQFLLDSNVATSKNGDVVFILQQETALAQFRSGTSRYFGFLHRRVNNTDNEECRWCVAHRMKEMGLPPQLLAPPPEPPPSAYFAMHPSDPVLCPVCYPAFPDREQLKKHIVRAYKITDAAELSTMVSLALHASPPEGFYRCTLCPFFTRSCDFFTKRHMFLHGLLHLDTRTPVKKVRIVEELECLVCKRLVAATHMKRHVEAAHNRPMDRKSAGSAVTAPLAAASTKARPTTEPRLQICPSCNHSLSTIPGILYHVRQNHPERKGLKAIGDKGKDKVIPVHPRLHICLDCGAESIKPDSLRRHRENKHGERHPATPCTPLRLECEETPSHLMVCEGLAELQKKHEIGPGYEVEAKADVKLANFVVDMTRFAPHQGGDGSTAAVPMAEPTAQSEGASDPPIASTQRGGAQETVPGHRHEKGEADEVPPLRLRMVQLQGGCFVVAD